MNINKLLEKKDNYFSQLNKYYKNSKVINKIKKEIYKINILLAPKNKFLLLLNDYYENQDLDEEKRKKIMNKINKKIYTLVNYVKKKPFFISKNKTEKKLIFLIRYINYYTTAYKDVDIEHYDFKFVKNEKIIHNIFLKYIIDEEAIISSSPNITDLSHLDIFNIIRYTAIKDFNINNIYENITRYAHGLINLNALDINLNNKYIPPYDIIIENIPFKKKKTFKSEIGNKFFDSNYNTLYIYEDKNYNEHLTNEKGVEYDYIRKYNFMGKGRIPLGAGIITQDSNSIEVSIDEIKELISKYKYKKIKFLSDVNANNETLFFSTNKSLSDIYKKFIADKIYNLKDILFKDDKERIFNNAKNPRKKNPITPKNEEIIQDNPTYLPQKLEEKINHNPKYNSSKLHSQTVKISEDIDKKSPRINYLPIPILKNPSTQSSTQAKKENPSAKPYTQPFTQPSTQTKKKKSPTKPFTQPFTKPSTKPSTQPFTQSPTKPSTQPSTQPFTQSPKKPSTQPSTPKTSSEQKVIEIEIIPSVFIGLGQPGDFLWEITTNYRGTDTLYIFNDNFKDHNTSEPGGNNGIIREFNRHSNPDDPNFIPRSAGISTGWGDGIDLIINGQKIPKDGAFKKEDKKYWKEIIDNEITEIIEHLLKTGYYKRIIFSAQGDKDNKPKIENGIPILGTYIFKNLDPEITTYIPNQIYKRLQRIKINSKINNKDFVQILIKNISSIKTSSKELIISNYTFENIIQDYLYYYSDKKNGINIFANKLFINNTIDSERKLKQFKILNLLNKKNCIHIPFLYNKVDINNQLSIYFTEYLDNNLFYLLNEFKKIPIDNHIVNVIKNMMQQLLMAIISYHTNTSGYINTNINSKNIYFKYNKENIKNTYICYKVYETEYYIKHNGYIWYLTDFSESINLPKEKHIIFNENYDSYHIYCEFKVIVETIKFELYNKNNTVLNSFIENILTIINNYKTSMKENFDKFKNNGNILKYMDTMLFQELMFDLGYETDIYNKTIYDNKVYKIL